MPIVQAFTHLFIGQAVRAANVVVTNTESKKVTHQGQKSPENSQNNDPEDTLNEFEISTKSIRLDTNSHQHIVFFHHAHHLKIANVPVRSNRLHRGAALL
ncbi:MAG: hypothetical protein ACK53X_03685 [Holosporales bacterium]